MPSKNILRWRIFHRLVNAISFTGLRKKPSVVFGLAFVLLLTCAAYYALKCNLSYSKPQYRPAPKYRSEGSMSRSVYSEDVLNSKDEIKLKHPYSQMGIPFIMDSKKPYIAQERIVHFDLKGAPPSKEYLKRLFPMLKNLGATGILIEYEDMFPYDGNLIDITAYNHYSRKDVLEILSMAESSELKVIPLVQTFGHLEFALKRPSFQNLRENKDSPQALCPSKNASLVFIENMISQIMELHRHRITHIHIGCDEVFHLGECELCLQRSAPVDDGDRSKDILFLKHVINVASIIKKRWPEVRPLIWDDMIRHIPDGMLAYFEIGKYVDPVVWWYTEDIYRFVPPIIWQKYSRAFRTAWTASAYKGAFGETLNMPDARRHLENNMQWSRVMHEQNKYFKDGLAGIMLTGWQRYDHFSVLCELLPAALPSLSLCLLAASHGDINATSLYLFGTTLGCPETNKNSDPPVRFNLDDDPNMWRALINCIFPGSNFFKAMEKFSVFESEAIDFIDQIRKRRGWLTEYTVRHRFVPPERVDSAISGELDANRILRQLTSLAEFTRAALDSVVDKHTIDEWIEQRPYPLILQIEQIISEAESLKQSKMTWERRPLKPAKGIDKLTRKTEEAFPP